MHSERALRAQRQLRSAKKAAETKTMTPTQQQRTDARLAAIRSRIARIAGSDFADTPAAQHALRLATAELLSEIAEKLGRIATALECRPLRNEVIDGETIHTNSSPG